jgi:hypothetical protein
MIRIRFSAASVRSIKTRATDLSGRTYCELCGAECPTRDSYEIDHCVAEGLQDPYDPRLPLSADHGKLLCLKCHDQKTRRDVFEIAKAKRVSAKHRVVGSGPTEIARRYGMRQEPHK